MDKILITGASGNIGAPLIQTLRLQGADFEIMRSRADSGGTARVASFADLASLKAAFTKFSDGLDTTVALKKAGDNVVSEDLNKIAPQFTAALASVRKSVTDFQAELEVRMNQEQHRNELFVMGGAGACCRGTGASLVTSVVSA